MKLKNGVAMIFKNDITKYVPCLYIPVNNRIIIIRISEYI